MSAEEFLDIPRAVTLIARSAVEAYLTAADSNFDLPEATPEYLLKNRAGVFVSVYDCEQELRGRIGTYLPTQPNIALEVVANAISIIKNDKRFKPLAKDELETSLFCVDILAALQPIESFAELDPEKYGVFLQKDQKKAIVLPGMEGIPNVEQQIKLVMNRAGLENYYGADIYRFESVRCFEPDKIS